MGRWAPYALLFILIAVPGLAFAGSHMAVGGALDLFFPLDADMYGKGLTDNSWGRDILGKEYSVGEDRVQFVGPNRYSVILSPVLIQSYFWDRGPGIELSEQFQYLFFSPNKDVDIGYERFMVPIRLTFKWTFRPDKKVRPFIGAGGGIIYTLTHISGKGLYDQERNPDYTTDDTEDADSGLDGQDDSGARPFFTENREFGRSGWYPGVHATAGVDIKLKYDLALVLGLRYEYVPIETIEVEFVSDGIDEWHWKERKLEGDAGGIAASVGVTYVF